MLKLGYQFVLVFLFARQCYLSPLNWNDLGQKAAETIIDSLVHNALKSAMGDESSRGLGKIQQQGNYSFISVRRVYEGVLVPLFPCKVALCSHVPKRFPYFCSPLINLHTMFSFSNL
mgnify:CR=1 FL=1